MGLESIGGGAVVGEELDTVSVLTPGTTVTLDASKGSQFTLTPAQNATLSATNLSTGEKIYLVVTTSGTTSYTLTFGSGFLTTGTLATGTVTGKTFMMELTTQNNVLTEVARTTAM